MIMFTAKNGCKWQFEGVPIKVPITLNFQQSPPQILIKIPLKSPQLKISVKAPLKVHLKFSVEVPLEFPI